MKYLRKLLSIFLSLSLVMLPALPTQAAVVGNAELFGATEMSTDRNLLMEALERDTARQQLAALGITQEQAFERINQMTDQEIALLNQQLADLPAGGDLLSLVVLIFLVFVITDVIGATDIFPFIRPVR
ncbi:MAG: PA2779 family protein [Gammaproteobacteria bacterium]|nr:PA2779 family protein [Gammaproteobacteria bacterium]